MNSNPATPRSAFSALFRPWSVRLAAGAPILFAALGSYDAASNQFNLPKLPALWGRTIGLVPAWAWFMLIQYALFFAILRYVRRQQPASSVATVDPRLDGIVERQKAIIDDYQRMTAIEARLNGELDGVKEGIQHTEERTRMNLEVLERKINSFAPLIAKVEEGRVHNVQNERDIEKLGSVVEKNARRVAESFAALQIRDQIRNYEDAMLRTSHTLYDRLKAGDTYSDAEWKDWTGYLIFWEMNLSAWINAAQWYAPNVEKRILTIDEKLYAGPWTVRDDQIPTAEGTRQFRKFRLLERQWEAVREEVANGIAQVAFVGMSERDMQRRPEAFS
jgi:hypothetical protein